MKSKVAFPKSIQELQGMGNNGLKELWLRYFKEPPMITDNKMVRILWCKIQCETYGLQIHQKNITRLNRYAVDPEKYVKNSYRTKYQIKSGTEIVKRYKGREYKAQIVSPSECIYDNRSFKSLSAVALVICRKKVSGYDFFGLNNKTLKKSMVDDGEFAKDGDPNLLTQIS